MQEKMLKSDIDKFVSKAMTALHDNRPNDVHKYFGEALDYLSFLSVSEQAILLEQHAEAMSFLGEFDKSETSLLEAIKKNQDLDNIPAVTKNLSDLAEIYTKFGAYESAIRFLNDAIGIASSNKDLSSVAKFQVQLSDCYMSLNQTNEAEESLGDALRYYRDTGNDYRKAQCLSRLSDICAIRGDLTLAKDFLKDAMDIFDKIHALPWMANTNRKFCNIFLLKKEYRAAADTIEKAITQYTELKDDHNIGISSLTAADVYEAIDELGTAHKHLDHAYLIFQETNDRHHLGLCLRKYANIHLRSNEREAAYEALEQAFDHALSQSDQQAQEEILERIETTFGTNRATSLRIKSGSPAKFKSSKLDAFANLRMPAQIVIPEKDDEGEEAPTPAAGGATPPPPPPPEGPGSDEASADDDSEGSEDTNEDEAVDSKTETPLATTALENAIAGYLGDRPDNEDETDALGVNAETAAFARLIANQENPSSLAIGIFGNWGQGKSYFMERLHRQIRFVSEQVAANSAAHKDKKIAICDHIIPIRFNAWHYTETNLWASLVHHIFGELDAYHSTEADALSSLLEKMATSREMELSELETLILRQKELQAAQSTYDQKKLEFESQPIAPADLLKGALKELLSGPHKEQRNKLKDVFNTAGGDELQKEIEALKNLHSSARNEIGRMQKIYHSVLASKLGTGGTVFWICAIIVLSIAIPFGVNWLDALYQNDAILSALKETVTGFTTVLAGAALFGTTLLARVKKGVDTVSGVFNAIEDDLKSKFNQTEAVKQFEEKKRELSAAKDAFTTAQEKSGEALHEFKAKTGKQRISDFIRERLEDQRYMKHLGIISTVHQDFKELSALMLPKTKESKATRQKLEEDYDLFKAQYQKLAAEYNAFIPEGEKIPSKPKPLPKKGTKQTYRVVLYIDDLDRCPHDKVVDVLQAVHLLLSFPVFTVVCAVDIRWTAHALAKRHAGLIETETRYQLVDDSINPIQKQTEYSEAAPAWDYMEKIFQIPFWVKDLDSKNSAPFIKTLIGEKEEKPSPQAKTPSTDTPPPPPSGGLGKSVDVDNPPPTNRNHSLSENSDTNKPATSGNNFLLQKLTLSEKEKSLMTALSPYLGTSPRRMKRFVNCYHLLKSFHSSEKTAPHMNWGESADEIETNCAAMLVMLAIVTSSPRIAPIIFKMIINPTEDKAIQTLVSLNKRLKKITSEDPDVLSELDASMQIVDTFTQKAACKTRDFFERCQKSVPLVSRFSFTAAQCE